MLNKSINFALDLTRFNGHTSITQIDDPCRLTKAGATYCALNKENFYYSGGRSNAYGRQHSYKEEVFNGKTPPARGR